MSSTNLPSINLEAFGISVEELTNRIIERITKELIGYTEFDDEGDEIRMDTPLGKRLRKKVVEKTDQVIEELANRHILPNLDNFIRTAILQRTTEWGEKIGEPGSFLQYLENRTNNWLTEKVNDNGKTQREEGSFWKRTQTRIMYLIDRRISDLIDTAVKNILTETNKIIGQGLKETIATQLSHMAQNLQVTVKTK